MSSELPQELVDQVIDHLWDDFVSLAACSLTCHAWLPSSRTHLFRHVDLDSPSACFRFQQLLKTSPKIAPFVRKVRVRSYSLSQKPPALGYEEIMWESHVPRLLSRLPRLTDLNISSLNWGTLHLTAVHGGAFLSRLGSVKRLTLADVHFETSAQVRSMLAAASNLEELYFDRVYWNNSSACVPLNAPVCQMPRICTSLLQSPFVPTSRDTGGRRLQELMLRSGSPSDLVIDWLLGTGEVRLRKLHVSWRDRRNAKALCALLIASGPHLKHLHMELTNGVAGLMQNEMQLGLLTSLRYVHFDGLILSDCGDWITTMVAQLTSPYLNQMEISLLARWTDDLCMLDWNKLDAALSRGCFVGVVVTLNVNLAIYRANKEEDARMIVELGLPEFQKLGTLLVKCS
ncbi:uncharacterized protein FIBRA_05956 [Fibroporia radiculosa]|uniref:F-box domain-containing protein n=1 Tax=Fibroporia radiculosa TaxID=599839 RepID=J4GAE8_9APHY|nr:uncharacterized protein FIBRA_05956 [Fibroporia radiculosa]CCM03808.1 predicted protein [Fibroporia radiculosa]